MHSEETLRKLIVEGNGRKITQWSKRSVLNPKRDQPDGFKNNLFAAARHCSCECHLSMKKIGDDIETGRGKTEHPWLFLQKKTANKRRKLKRF